MAMAVTHFAVGAACTALCLALVRPRHPFRTTVVFLGGVWGLLPDIHWVSPVFEHSLHMFHRHSGILDVFWFHRVLDTHEIAEGRVSGAVSLVAFLLIVLAWETSIEVGVGID